MLARWIIVKPGTDFGPLLFHDDPLKKIDQVVHPIAFGHRLEYHAIGSLQVNYRDEARFGAPFYV